LQEEIQEESKHNPEFIAVFKISLSHFGIEELQLRNEELQGTLSESDYHILYIDITQDFRGSFDGEELVSVLEKFDPNYKLQKSFSNSCVTVKSQTQELKCTTRLLVI